VTLRISQDRSGKADLSSILGTLTGVVYKGTFSSQFFKTFYDPIRRLPSQALSSSRKHILWRFSHNDLELARLDGW